MPNLFRHPIKQVIRGQVNVLEVGRRQDNFHLITYRFVTWRVGCRSANRRTA